MRSYPKNEIFFLLAAESYAHIAIEWSWISALFQSAATCDAEEVEWKTKSCVKTCSSSTCHLRIVGLRQPL